MGSWPKGSQGLALAAGTACLVVVALVLAVRMQGAYSRSANSSKNNNNNNNTKKKKKQQQELQQSQQDNHTSSTSQQAAVEVEEHMPELLEKQQQQQQQQLQSEQHQQQQESVVIDEVLEANKSSTSHAKSSVDVQPRGGPDVPDQPCSTAVKPEVQGDTEHSLAASNEAAEAGPDDAGRLDSGIGSPKGTPQLNKALRSFSSQLEDFDQSTAVAQDLIEESLSAVCCYASSPFPDRLNSSSMHVEASTLSMGDLSNELVDVDNEISPDNGGSVVSAGSLLANDEDVCVAQALPQLASVLPGEPTDNHGDLVVAQDIAIDSLASGDDKVSSSDDKVSSSDDKVSSSDENKVASIDEKAVSVTETRSQDARLSPSSSSSSAEAAPSRTEGQSGSLTTASPERVPDPQVSSSSSDVAAAQDGGRTEACHVVVENGVTVSSGDVQDQQDSAAEGSPKSAKSTIGRNPASHTAASDTSVTSGNDNRTSSNKRNSSNNNNSTNFNSSSSSSGGNQNNSSNDHRNSPKARGSEGQAKKTKIHDAAAAASEQLTATGKERRDKAELDGLPSSSATATGRTLSAAAAGASKRKSQYGGASNSPQGGGRQRGASANGVRADERAGDSSSSSNNNKSSSGTGNLSGRCHSNGSEVAADDRSDASADSGKGGSDCPPLSGGPSGAVASCIATNAPANVNGTAGGCGSAGPAGPVAFATQEVYEFELPMELCGRLIGRQGCTVKAIKNATGATITVREHATDQRLKTVFITGSFNEVQNAIYEVRKKFPLKRYPHLVIRPSQPVTSGLCLPVGADVQVNVTDIETAAYFFVQLPTHCLFPSFRQLEESMSAAYGHAAHIRPPPLGLDKACPGVLCVLVSESASGTVAYRVLVESVVSPEQATIKYVDYGGFDTVPLSQLKQIRQDFYKMPFQAVEVVVAGVEPLDGSGQWSAGAVDFVRSLLESMQAEGSLFARVVSYQREVAYVQLTGMLPGGQRVSLADCLVAEKFARWVEASPIVVQRGGPNDLTAASSVQASAASEPTFSLADFPHLNAAQEACWPHGSAHW